MQLIRFLAGLLYLLSLRLTAWASGERNVGAHQRTTETLRIKIPALDEVTIEELQALLQTTSLTSYDLAYVERAYEVNTQLHAVSELNPDASSIARILDAERASGRTRGQATSLLTSRALPLHGIPILIKDNIATKDKMNNTAGSYALVGAKVSRESTVVAKLRDAGAIILGKSTMGEWAQFRSRKASSSHGWSAYGGQGLGAYYPLQDPSGSSSGSAVAVSVGLASGGLATETSGSIVNPAERSNVVGIKPTLGLTSRSMVIPISVRQDTIGPMARTVKDAAYILSAITGKDKYDNWTSAQPFEKAPDYVKACQHSSLKGARIGVPRNGIDYFLDNSTGPIMAAFEDALRIISNAGATVVDDADFPEFDFPAFSRNSSIVLDTDFVTGIFDYLSMLKTNPKDIHNLHDIAHFTKTDPREQYPDRDTYVWDRELARNISSDSIESWSAFQANLRMAEEYGVLGAISRYELDALIMPTFASFHLPAIAGLPVITIPLGYYPAKTALSMNLKGTMVSVAPNIPFGIAFVGRRWSEETLISFAYALEQRTLIRKMMKPLIAPTFELGQLTAKTAHVIETFNSRETRLLPVQQTSAQSAYKDHTNLTSSTPSQPWSWLGLLNGCNTFYPWGLSSGTITSKAIHE